MLHRAIGPFFTRPKLTMCKLKMFPISHVRFELSSFCASDGW